MVAKRAVLVACNYPGTNAELKGCISDAKIHKSILIEKKGFKESDIKVLIDDEDSELTSYAPPTGENIKKALTELCESAQPGDFLFFSFSGHGTQVPGGAEEEDGKNEALCPTDMNLLVDDDIRDIVNKTKKGVTLTLVCDCCHSGGMIDHSSILIDSDKKADPDAPPVEFRSRELPISGVAERLSQLLGKTVDPNGTAVRGAIHEKYGAAASKFAVGMFENYTGKKMGTEEKKKLTGMITSCFSALGVGGGGGGGSDHSNAAPAVSGGSAGGPPKKVGHMVHVDEEMGILITGCRAHETSADVRENGQAFGALSKNLHLYLETKPDATFYEVVHGARDRLADKGFTQNPCLECAKDNAALPYICPNV
ncbi:Metacaspase-7 [Porphyridium purpureum]|uniref:Metacaspase-7 n=1 Tax=Porphyridium purpureum TaxID=35688 RepID=A0A5J4YH25_PORPP|nr:Metacaspase-7 [Porphyridium purpureum]|eukprot:POR8673..scf270_19